MNPYTWQLLGFPRYVVRVAKPRPLAEQAVLLRFSVARRRGPAGEVDGLVGCGIDQPVISSQHGFPYQQERPSAGKVIVSGSLPED